jgi:serine/threonine protein kinase
MNIGRYQIMKEIGKGSMGVVYQAHDPNLDLQVALKVLRQDRLVSEPYVRRFLTEARALGRFDHSNIVRVFNVDEDSGTVYIAMEFIEGESLNEIIQKKQFPIDEIVHIGITVAETLDYAHQKGIIHRDIKPSNIIIRSDDRLKITDFGIAHIEDPSGTQQTQAGEILGTPAYMSPEQVMSHPVDGRSDLFSLGIILYEMSTGKRPFTGDSLPALFHAITGVTPPEPFKVNPGIPRGLSQIIMKCIMKKPEERFSSGKALAEALKSVLHEKEPAYQTKPAWAGRSKMMIVSLAIVLVIMIGIVGAYYFSSTRKSESLQPPSVQKPVRATALNVESAPEGAQVFIDGALKGVTPLKLDISAGKYEVKLSLPNYYDWEAQVKVDEGNETPLVVQLIPSEGKKF